MPGPGQDDPVASKLAELREDTEVVARGRFRVDAAGAAARARHLLATTDEWLLPLISAATLGGATRFDVSEGWGGITVEFDGASPDLEEVEAISTGIPVGGSLEERRLRELALSLHVAHASGAPKLEFVSACGARLRFEGPRVHVEAREPSASNVVRLAHPSQLTALRCAIGMPTTAGRILRQRAQFAPPGLSVRLRGARVNPPIELGLCAGSAVLAGPGFEALLGFAPTRAFVTRRRDAAFSAIVGVSGLWYRDEFLGPYGAMLAFVRDGVAVITEKADLGNVSNLRAVIHAPDVRFDASRAQVVRDAAFEAVISELRAEVRTVLEELLERWKPGAGEDPEWLYSQALESLERDARRAGQLSVSCRVHSTLERVLDANLRRRDDYGGYVTRQHASILLKRGEAAAARPRLERLVELRKRKWRSVSDADASADLAAFELESGRFESAARFAKRAFDRGRREYSPKFEPVDRLLEYLALSAEHSIAIGEPPFDEVRRALRLFPKNPPRHHSLEAVARFYLAAGMPGEAGEWAGRALADVEAWPEPHPERHGAAHLLAAVAALGRGEPQQSLDHAMRAREHLEKAFGEDHPELAGAAVISAVASAELDRTADAEGWLDRAERSVSSCFGPQHPEAALLLELRAAVTARGGDPAGAALRLADWRGPAWRRASLDEWRAHLLRVAGAGDEAALLLGSTLSSGTGFRPHLCLLTASHGAFWTDHTPRSCRHRPVRLRLPAIAPAALAQSARQAAITLYAAGRPELAGLATMRAQELEKEPSRPAGAGRDLTDG